MRVCIFRLLPIKSFMSYLQVKAILDKASKLHQLVGEYAEVNRKATNDDFFSALLTLISDHETQLQQALEEFTDTAEAGVRGTWVQYPGDEAVTHAIDVLQKPEAEDHQAVLKQVLEAEQALVDMFQQAERETNAPTLQSLFQRLGAHQQQHVRAIGKCASQWQQFRRPKY